MAGDLAFCQDNGHPISRTEDWREWKTILKKADVHDGRLRDARHTAATHLVEQGVHIRVVHRNESGNAATKSNT